MTKSEQRQADILRCIYDHVSETGYPPTVREICNVVGLSSTSTVHGHLSKLEQNGYIKRDPTKPRAIEITYSGLELIDETPTKDQIPIVGTVTAGEPILAVESDRDYFPLPPNFESADDLFMLTVRGESMINAGILSGDQVIVRKQNYADNGDVVIAMTDEDEATCKRFFKETNYFRLQPENDTMEPIILHNVAILGKVIGLYRSII